MSDAKANDQGDQRQPNLEVQPMQSADVEAARLVGRVEIDRAEQARSNPSDGSLRHYQAMTQVRRNVPAAYQEQNQSIELIAGDVSVSRANPLKEANLSNGVNADGTPFQVYTAQAGQALENPGDIDKRLTEGDYQSSVKLNVQITNVLEVSTGIKPDELLGYVGQVMEAGAKAVRPIEEHLFQPNAVTQDLWNLPGNVDTVMDHLAQSPEQLNEDVAVVTGRILDTIDKPMTANERARAAGSLMPMFFFEGGGKPLDKTAANQMKLDQMTAEELKLLGIERVEMHMPEVPRELQHLELTKAEPQLLDLMRAKGREIILFDDNSQEFLRLKSMGKEASVILTDDGIDYISLKANPSKIAALEEFLHGTQRKIPLLKDQYDVILEIEVKDFMIRHRKLLGLSDNDVAVLDSLKQREIQEASRLGMRWIP